MSNIKFPDEGHFFFHMKALYIHINICMCDEIFYRGNPINNTCFFKWPVLA